MTELPKILLIDDEASEALLPEDCKALLLTPNDPHFNAKLPVMLETADLVLLDQNLALPSELSLTATDGASLVGHLRSWARNKSVKLPPLVIYTSEDEAFANELPKVGPAVPLAGSFVGQEARLAPALDVEWLILKGAENAYRDIRSIAMAFLDLRVAAENDKVSLGELNRYLRMPETAWSDIAIEHIMRARPPLSEPVTGGVEGARGTTPILRWLLQRIIPYSGLLLSDSYAAWALGIQLESLSALLEDESGSEWVNAVKQSTYEGPAFELSSRRWWAAGIDYAAWNLRQECDKAGSLEEALKKLTAGKVQALESDEFVVVVDLDFKEQGLALLEDAMQIHPPGWPSEANEPWMLQELLAKEPLAQTMLDSADRASFK
ncbi:hypothetical protein AB9F35_11230 [Rhizobium leguminosarum]|uniref:hypothetical protein n=1 Tax=Rhizobium leguminosarum TaxID=384 RepID=UPI003F94CCFC